MVEKKFLTQRANPSNRFLTEDALQGMFQKIGLTLPVNSVSVYQQAFVHRSYLQNSTHEQMSKQCTVSFQEKCNETYEYLGDTVLNSIVGSFLYQTYPDENEGFLTKARTKMVRGTTLGKLALKLGFGDWLILSRHVDLEGGRTNLRILEDVFEAFIAAIYLDNGANTVDANWSNTMATYNAMKANGESTIPVDFVERMVQMWSNANGYLMCQLFVHAVYQTYIDINALVSFDDNYKEQLQTHYQRVNDMFPKWELLKEDGKTNCKTYTIGIRDRCGFIIGKATERKKTEAEQKASFHALVYMGILDGSHSEATFFRT